MMGRKIRPSVKATSLPKLLDSRFITQMPMTILAMGIKIQISH